MPNIQRYARYLAAWIALGSICASAVADEIKVGSGIDCSSGKYGQPTPVEICVYPNNIHAFLGSYEFKLSLPYIEVRDGSGVQGYADASIYAGKTIVEDFAGIDAIDLGIKIKARNGSVDLGLGTGRMAYAGGVALTLLPEAKHLYLMYFGITSGSRQDSKVGSYATIWYKYLANSKLRVGLIYENNEIGYSGRIETLTLMPEIVITSEIVIKPFIYVGLNSFAPSKGAGLVASYSFH